MSITYHTNFKSGSYKDDRNLLFKYTEARDLLSGKSTLALKPYFDGKSIAIGYENQWGQTPLI